MKNPQLLIDLQRNRNKRKAEKQNNKEFLTDDFKTQIEELNEVTSNILSRETFMVPKPQLSKADSEMNDRDLNDSDYNKKDLISFDQWNIPQLLEPDDLEPKEMNIPNAKSMKTIAYIPLI